MNIKQLIIKNIFQNIKDYALYLFALTFSVAIYFSFVTLQFDPAMDQIHDLANGPIAVRTGSIVLIFIVLVFLLYANNLFLKQRGKEIGLFQLIGMSKGKVFRILSIENLILYTGSLLLGIFIGFATSKLANMILLKIVGIEAIAELNFSIEAFTQTIIVFAFIYLIIMLMNYFSIRKQSILSLFQLTTTTETKVKKLSIFSMIMGIFGIALVISGYYVSTMLFSGDFSGFKLFFAMAWIAGSMILGTYFIYKNSIGFIFHLIRKGKSGRLTLNNVVSLSPMMFRMKSNAMLLTVVTIISTLTVSLLSLTYIAYYSAEKQVEEVVPNHFATFNADDREAFTNELDKESISYTLTEIDTFQMMIDFTSALSPGSYDNLDLQDDPRTITRVVNGDSIPNTDLSKNETILTKPDDVLEKMLSFQNTGTVSFFGEENTTDLKFIGLSDDSILPLRLTSGFPIAIVNKQQYSRLKQDYEPSLQDEFLLYIGIDINNSRHVDKANEIFHKLGLNKWTGIWEEFESQPETFEANKQSMGLLIFVAGFLGLIFLTASGCILYFKQMDESEAEKVNYTILRKIGFTEKDLLKGIRIKQIISFGIPLILGLCHSYFTVKSGWFIFGSEMWTPMITVMALYAVLYSVYGFLSVQHYKRVIKYAL